MLNANKEWIRANLIFDYYWREHPELNAGAGYIGWAIDDGVDDMLPAIKSDIMLSRGKFVLNVDAKYYGRAMQQQFDKRAIHSDNLHQIFTCVKNKEAEFSNLPHEVSGLLLYAKADEEIQLDAKYRMSGNRIGVKTFDLGQSFEEIRAQLDGVARARFQA